MDLLKKEWLSVVPTKDPDTSRSWGSGNDTNIPAVGPSANDGKYPSLANPPRGITVLCCSQSFSNIDASSVSFKNISQECSANIKNDILANSGNQGSGNQESGNQGSGNQESGNQEKVKNNNNSFLGMFASGSTSILSCIFLVFSIIIVGVMVYSSGVNLGDVNFEA